MFAFCFYDRVTREIVLARDRFGIKPLYWYQKGSTYYFASEMKAIPLPHRLSRSSPDSLQYCGRKRGPSYFYGFQGCQTGKARFVRQDIDHRRGYRAI